MARETEQEEPLDAEAKYGFPAKGLAASEWLWILVVVLLAVCFTLCVVGENNIEKMVAAASNML